ncbi:acetyl-CoA carboxylase biotin carboxyl carrier protein [Pectinatus sottacetonis]|uniref:acetyl-CoA carboxylase biotin carboxyl carrier protein n=1 Tax=Pectinatus sottacetonis TaxID=1002795 RepID=UPI001E35A09A|nr:acetyl-CoA carboxylase biotin carboxyl carrier protein [Pectinatus sottacetonis]
MLQLEEIKELINTLDHSALNKLNLKFSDGEITLEKSSSLPAVSSIDDKKASIPAPPPFTANEKIEEITAPMVGTFYSSPEPDIPSFVEKGSKVHPNTVVCILEAMKLFSEIEAQTEGEIIEVLVKDGDFVEYGQPLFKVKTY